MDSVFFFFFFQSKKCVAIAFLAFFRLKIILQQIVRVLSIYCIESTTFFGEVILFCVLL